MSKRGKVLRDLSAGPGLLIVEGQQYPFTLDGVWRSAEAPKAGMSVDVEFDAQGGIQGISAVPESQVAKEQAEVAMAAAKQKGAAIASSLVAKFGMPDLIAFAVIIIAWFFLSAVSIDVPLAGKMSFTFWQVLGFLNTNNLLDILAQNGSPSAGMYGFLAILCLAGPAIQHFWKDKRAVWGGALPLVFMAIVGLMVRSAINKMMGGAASGPLGDMQEQAQDEMMKAVTIGFGIYASALASIYFAGMAAKKFLTARATP